MRSLGWASQLSLLLCCRLLAEHASIGGRVTCGHLAPVAASIVTVIEPQSGRKRAVLTNGGGYFSLPNLPPGEYLVEVVKPGFQRAERTTVYLRAGATLILDLRLAPDPDTDRTTTLLIFLRIPAFWP